MTATRRVLLVEDDAHIADLLTLHLRDEGLEVMHCARGDDGLRQLERGGWDALVLDIMLPGVDGLEICRRARAMARYTPIIIISARSSEVQRILGLEIGADDYLAKPFSLPELLARMHAITRRRFGLHKPLVGCGAFELDLQSRRLLHQGEEVNLSVKEFDVLSYLVLHKNRVMTRLQLTEHIWGNLPEAGFDSNYIDAHIKNLRKKLGQLADVEWLETVRGVGYRVKL